MPRSRNSGEKISTPVNQPASAVSGPLPLKKGVERQPGAGGAESQDVRDATGPQVRPAGDRREDK